jgi:hypothetical protein
MPDIEYPSDVIAAQQAVDGAWAAVEAHRREVDAARREETPDERGRPGWVARPLRPWTEAEDARHAELLAAARKAAEVRRAALAASGLGEGYDVVQGLHAAARAV